MRLLTMKDSFIHILTVWFPENQPVNYSNGVENVISSPIPVCIYFFMGLLFDPLNPLESPNHYKHEFFTIVGRGNKVEI